VNARHRKAAIFRMVGWGGVCVACSRANSDRGRAFRRALGASGGSSTSAAQLGRSAPLHALTNAYREYCECNLFKELLT
jgi:hypothetical protein